MELDDSEKPEFASWESYRIFSQRVRHQRRYVWDQQIQAFLDTVVATLKNRDVRIPKGTILYRAQRDVQYDPIFDEDGTEIADEPHAFGPERMKPLKDRAKEGRANAAGIPVLYLASTIQTAISEVRPWIGSAVSVAQFEIIRALKAVNLTLGHGQSSISHLHLEHLFGDKQPDAATKEKAVWIEIDNAFSRPVTASDDAADYVPTQILTELFKSREYDAIIYRSQFGKKGHNVALFDIADAEAINGTPYEVRSIEVIAEEIGNSWFKSKKPRQKKRYFRRSVSLRRCRQDRSRFRGP